jgi:hypothetical protein
MRSTSRPRSVRAGGRGLALFAVALAMCGLGAGCGPSQHVGRPCELGTTAMGGASGQIATFSSPALECPSHVCLLPAASVMSSTGPVCTAACESNEDCADGETADASNPADRRCHGGFVCMWPTTVGSFACQRLCVCTDFVNPAGGFTKPEACR